MCEPEGEGAAVLIRALEPLDGIAEMRARRGRHCASRTSARGPGKLTQALAIGLDLNGTVARRRARSRFGPPAAARPAVEIAVGPRIGITKAVDLPWRFCAVGSRHVSRPWPPGHRDTLAA